MLQHYFTIALRNLKKYRLQSIISVFGLAVGFACFALSALWIRYELTFDTFHPDAERMYWVRYESELDNSGISPVTPYPLAGYLKETFPEVELACNTQAWQTGYKAGGEDLQSFKMSLDSASMKMFDIRLLSGSLTFISPGSNDVAISNTLAQKLYGAKSPIGEVLEAFGNKMQIVAVVQGWTAHSNIPFEILTSNQSMPEWYMSGWQTFIKVREGIDMKQFEEKLYKHLITQDQIELTHIRLTPITAMRYDKPMVEATVRFEHILLFAIAGGLIILCALFNYLTLFVNRIRMRAKEVGLRQVCGSSNSGLLALFSAEYILTLFAALLLGMVLIEMALPSFKEISDIKVETWDIYTETLIYSVGVILLSFVFSSVVVYSFRRQSLNQNLQSRNGGSGRNVFFRVSLVIQFIISLGFIFCSSVLVKQIHHLNTVDVGFERANRASIAVYPPIEGLKDELKQLPFITEIFPGDNEALFPQFGKSVRSLTAWDDKPASVSKISLEILRCSRAYFDFYKLQLLAGELPEDGSSDYMLLNETAAKQMGFSQPIGKKMQWGDKSKIVAGIIKDFYIAPPTIPAKPTVLDFSVNENTSSQIIFKYQGDWATCESELKALVTKRNPNLIYANIWSAEEKYQEFWKSEKMLLNMLDFATLICMLVSLFGVFSLMTLDCERYRKEIAIRKINGASVWSIMRMFFRKYIELLLLASCISFPVGYLMMKSWIENYVMQTTISGWLYPVIWLALALLVTVSIGWRINRAARTNPADAIKSE